MWLLNDVNTDKGKGRKVLFIEIKSHFNISSVVQSNDDKKLATSAKRIFKRLLAFNEKQF